MNDSIENQHPYSRLTPDRILNAIDSSGRISNGRLLALNSYENRVYQIGLDNDKDNNGFVIVKFYRPQRWSDEAILEEHAFTRELSEQDLPVLTPLVNEKGNTLFEYEGFRFSLYQRCGGYAPTLDSKEDRLSFGRLMARIHAVGSLQRFRIRPTITIQAFGRDAATFLLENHFIPLEYQASYESLIRDLMPLIEYRFEMAGDFREIRLHGDCHPGNVLWTDSGPHLLDFDDARMGPAIQDLWMFLPGVEHELKIYLDDFLEGYQEFYDFDYRQIHMIEALRTLRIINYSAWLARRWHDPAFPVSFPWFNTARYWEDNLLSLREQMALLQEAESGLF